MPLFYCYVNCPYAQRLGAMLSVDNMAEINGGNFDFFFTKIRKQSLTVLVDDSVLVSCKREVDLDLSFGSFHFHLQSNNKVSDPACPGSLDNDQQLISDPK